MSAAPVSRLLTVCRLLNAAEVRYVIVGGFALALHGAIRATKDIDVLIEPTLDNARRALDALAGLTWGIARELDPAAVLAKPITIIGDDPRVDLLTLAWSVQSLLLAGHISVGGRYGAGGSQDRGQGARHRREARSKRAARVRSFRRRCSGSPESVRFLSSMKR